MSDVLNKGLRTATEGARGAGKVLQGFKDFISRGNAIELAVGVVIGAAFSGVITAIQNGFIAPLIAMIFGQPDISEIWKIGAAGEAQINMGLILNALLQFLITAAAIYFFIVLPLNKLAERRKRGIEAEPARPSEDILLLQEIRDLLAAQSSPALRQDAGPSSAPGTTEAPGSGGPGVTGRATGVGDPGHPPLA
ncbi:large conductance mechanosensitive channel protein MscL [Cellulomonas sp. ACRRI]|uniref:large conductance mechanosensitive channel protein MscL n=1 Tax=Cellulomonas sp. ACRRI TaxID=2918188 RepID=UPI001EF3B732|nr:large conductance mechanosensitive channel protein MscL [Cellulomonas sp. ACRRI]MCG7284931.1 large conductance mechanosensitive channel protein MscL [Cellulomonas sp. ACRRI]